VLELAIDTADPPVLEPDASAEILAAVRGLVASALAECHRLQVDATPLAARLPRAAPWVFDLPRPAPASLRELAPAQLSVIQALQSEPRAVTALGRLRDQWRRSRLVHGDFKWSNVLVRQDGAGPPLGVLLLDWEMAQLGDPAWDIGAVLHAFITEAVLEPEPAPGTGPDAAARLLGEAAGRVRSAHRDFWNRYRAAARLTDADANALLGRLPAHVAARLLKTAFEWSQAEAKLPRRAAAILQLGINMLLDPRAAGEVVLGLGSAATAVA
jgi:Ser/Thr protein kinase RdoA (MazF antagonist)